LLPRAVVRPIEDSPTHAGGAPNVEATIHPTGFNAKTEIQSSPTGTTSTVTDGRAVGTPLNGDRVIGTTAMPVNGNERGTVRPGTNTATGPGTGTSTGDGSLSGPDSQRQQTSEATGGGTGAVQIPIATAPVSATSAQRSLRMTTSSGGDRPMSVGASQAVTHGLTITVAPLSGSTVPNAAAAQTTLNVGDALPAMKDGALPGIGTVPTAPTINTNPSPKVAPNTAAAVAGTAAVVQPLSPQEQTQVKTQKFPISRIDTSYIERGVSILGKSMIGISIACLLVMAARIQVARISLSDGNAQAPQLTSSPFTAISGTLAIWVILSVVCIRLFVGFLCLCSFRAYFDIWLFS
jgi:hypothetical protein